MKKCNRNFLRFGSHFGLLAVALSAALAAGCGGGSGGAADTSVTDGTGSYEGTPSTGTGTGTGTIFVSWRAPTERESGDALALSDLNGYRIHWGPSGDASANEIVITDPSITTYRINGVPSGTYEITVTAVDTSGLESAPSNSMAKAL